MTSQNLLGKLEMLRPRANQASIRWTGSLVEGLKAKPRWSEPTLSGLSCSLLGSRGLRTEAAAWNPALGCPQEAVPFEGHLRGGALQLAVQSLAQRLGTQASRDSTKTFYMFFLMNLLVFCALLVGLQYIICFVSHAPKHKDSEAPKALLSRLLRLLEFDNLCVKLLACLR